MEVNSLVQTPRKQPASGNRLRESLQNFESLSKTVQFTKVCELASFLHRVEACMSYKTIPDVTMVLELSPQHAENIHFFGQTQDPERTQRFPGRTVIGPVVEVHVVQLLGNHEIENFIQPPNNPERTSWVVICRGKNRFVDELHIPDPGHNLTRFRIAKEGEPCSTELELSGTEKTRARPFRTSPDPVCFTKRHHTYEGSGKWKGIPACRSF